MNASIFWRLVWKEYRLQRAFWISMAVLTVLVELLVLAFVRPGPERITWLFAIGLGFPAFYALGCGATLFATEHEARTYEFQRSLPVSAMRLFGGKLAFALISIVAIIGLLWLLSAVMAGWRFPSPAEHLQLWGLWGMAAVELLLWGIFFSLLITRPLLAAILAATVASVTVQCTLGTISPSYYLEPYLAAIPYRLAIAAVVAIADLWLGGCWWRDLDLVAGVGAGLGRLGRFLRQYWALNALLLSPLVVLLANWQSSHTRHYAIPAWWWLLCFASLEVLVWAILYSLLVKRPLNVAIPFVAVISFGIHAGLVKGTLLYLDVMPLRAVVVAVVAGLDVWLAYRRRGETTVRARPVARTLPAAEVPRRTAFGRLLWQQWWQSVRMMAALSVLLVPLLLTVISLWGQRGPFDELRVAAVAVLALAGVPLMGACVFLADQRGHGFRFFAERGIRPGHVWLSRHLVWMAVLLPWTVLLLIVILLVLGPPAREPQHAVIILGILGYGFGLAILAYAGGQLCSMFLRSGILAGFFSLALSSLLFGWAGLMWFLQVPWIWSVLPIPAALLAATWLRTPGWLLERNSLRAWLWPALALFLPGTAVLIAVPVYRVYEIPAVDPGFSPEEFARPATAEERETFEMYRTAGLTYVPISPRKLPSGTDEETAPPEPEAERAAREKAWIEANAEVIALTLKASRRPACDFFDPRSDLSKAEVLWRCRSLGNLLIASAAQLESEGKLDAALERYLAAIRVSLHVRHRGGWQGADAADRFEREVYDHLTSWAAKPGQTPQQIKAAIRQLADLTQNVPSRSDVIESECLWIRGLMSAYPDTLARKLEFGRSPRVWAALTAQWLPWERARALRVLDFVTARELESFYRVEATVAQGRSFVLPEKDPESWAMMKLTPFMAAFYLEQSRQQARQLAAMETHRRAVCLLLALQAWKIEHGELPKTLDELVGPYLDRLPLDPYPGESFRYFPEGLPISITWLPWNASVVPWSSNKPEVVKAGTPFIWSTGLAVRVSEPGKTDSDRYQISTGRNTWRQPTSEYDVWASGWPFLLP